MDAVLNCPFFFPLIFLQVQNALFPFSLVSYLVHTGGNTMKKKFDSFIRAADKLADNLDVYNQAVISACGDVEDGMYIVAAGDPRILIEGLTSIIESIELETGRKSSKTDFDILMREISLCHKDHINARSPESLS